MCLSIHQGVYLSIAQMAMGLKLFRIILAYSKKHRQGVIHQSFETTVPTGPRIAGILRGLVAGI